MFQVDIIKIYYKTNGWNTILLYGDFTNEFYLKLDLLGIAPIVTNKGSDESYDIENIIPHHSNSLIIICQGFDEFESSFSEAITSPYWHPHSNVIIYCKSQMEVSNIGFMFYILWFHKVCNAIILYYEESEFAFRIFDFTPYVNEARKFENKVGCYTLKKIGRSMEGFSNDLSCEENCENVTITSKLRMNYLGTCIGFNYHLVQIGDEATLRKINLFEDKGINLHGFTLRVFVGEVLPFFRIEEHDNGSVSFHSRDGMIWNTVAEKMNFTMDLTPSARSIKEKFDFELKIQQVFSFSHRKVDLYLGPVYLIDLIIVKIDMSFPYKPSGVCFLSHRADYETMLFDLKIIEENYIMVIQFVVCILGVWFAFFIFNAVERENITLDQLGKDFLNAIRNILTINLHNPPKKRSFRIFLGISIWSFFVINFSMQAAVTSFFSSYKRGKEVETFEDIIEKGYAIEGMASPDVVMPEDDERFKKINSKLVPINNLFECVSRMTNDSRRFCLIDCAVAYYLQRNKLNEKGEQYLHVATDRVHSHYLTMIFHKYSPLTDQFNKYIMAFVESGIIKKWEDYKYNDIKEESVLKALSMEDLIGIFNCYLFSVALSCVIFGLEIILYSIHCMRVKCCLKLEKWYRKKH